MNLATMARPKNQNLLFTTTAVSCAQVSCVYLLSLSPSFSSPFSAYSVHELGKCHNAVGILRVRVESMDASTWLGRKTATGGSREPMGGKARQGSARLLLRRLSVSLAWLWLWTLSPGAVRGRRSGASDGGQ